MNVIFYYFYIIPSYPTCKIRTNYPESNWYQQFGDEKKNNIAKCSRHPHNKSFHVVDRTRSTAKCTIKWKKHVKFAKLECHCLNKQICDVISAVIGVVAQAPLIHSRLKTLGTLCSVLRVSQDSDHWDTQPPMRTMKIRKWAKDQRKVWCILPNQEWKLKLLQICREMPHW